MTSICCFTAGITDVKDDKPKDSKEKGLITASHRSPITTLTPIVSYTDRSEFNNLFILHIAWWTSFEIIISSQNSACWYHLKQNLVTSGSIFLMTKKNVVFFSNMFGVIIIQSID